MKHIKFSKSSSITASIVIFVIVLAELVFVCFPLQMMSPFWGLVATELIMLVTAIIGSVALCQNAKEVFPRKKPRLRQIFGVVVIFVAMYIMSLASISIVSVFMPEEALATNSGIASIFAGIPLWGRILVLAVLPAVCEEAIHRGLILHFLKPCQRKWAILLVAGVQFGLFHLDKLRFLNTAIAGAVIAYILLKTDNILLCMLLHFINNFSSALAAGSSEVTDGAAEIVSSLSPEIMSLSYAVSAGVFLFLSAAVPWLLHASSLLLSDERPDSSAKKKRLVAYTVISVACAVVGCAVFAVAFNAYAGKIYGQMLL